MTLFCRSFVLITLLGFTLTASAETTNGDLLNRNPFWINLRTKLVKYLDTTIDKSSYQYEIVGPVKPMLSFLGNLPDSEVKFEKLNLGSNSKRKTLTATAIDEDGNRGDTISINIDVMNYRDVYMLKHAASKGQEIDPSNFYRTKILVEPTNYNLYFDGNIAQKVSNIAIGAGVPIKVTMLRHEKLVQSGTLLKVMSGAGAIQLQLMCRTMSSGDIGEIVTTTCFNAHPSTRKVKIIDKGTATLI